MCESLTKEGASRKDLVLSVVLQKIRKFAARELQSLKAHLAQDLFDSLPDHGLVSENLMNKYYAETGIAKRTKYREIINSLDPAGFPESWTSDYDTALQTANVRASERVNQLWLDWVSAETQKNLSSLDKFFADLKTQTPVGDDKTWESSADAKQKEAENAWTRKISGMYKWKGVADVKSGFSKDLTSYIGVKKAIFQQNEAQRKSSLKEESGKDVQTL